MIVPVKESLNLPVESFELKEEKDEVFIEGLALPYDKVSRNGNLYTKESIEKTHETLVGRPMTFNHNTDIVLGHVVGTTLTPEGMRYKASLDPGETAFIRKIKRGDISNVSIQVYPESIEEDGDHLKIAIQCFLELGIVTIPGFADTTIAFAEKYLPKKKTEDCNKYGERGESPHKQIEADDMKKTAETGAGAAAPAPKKEQDPQAPGADPGDDGDTQSDFEKEVLARLDQLDARVAALETEEPAEEKVTPAPEVQAEERLTVNAPGISEKKLTASEIKKRVQALYS
jgi:phage head maturation protease